MKTAIHTLPQFSGYPLSQVTVGQTAVKHAIVFPIKKTQQKAAEKKQHSASVPANWDTAWFGNYE